MKNQVYSGTINRTLSHMILILFDSLCLWVIWAGINSYTDVLAEMRNHADIISFNSRLGFQIVCIGQPVIHLLIAVDYFWPVFLKKYRQLVSRFTVILFAGLFATAIIGSYWIQTRVEKTGYIYCRNASGVSALAKQLVYTKNMDICDELVETKRKPRDR